MTELYIPPPQIPFRLLGFRSNLVFFSRASPEPGFSHVSRDPEYRDQYFHLIPGTGKHSGSYLIEGQVSKYRIFSRTTSPPNVGQISSEYGTYEDNYFKLEPGWAAGNFRLVNPFSKTVLVSRPDQNIVDHYPLGYQEYSDQYFSFLFTDLKIDKVVYDIDEAKILQNTPQELAIQTLTNDTSIPQTMGFSVDETTTDTSTFEFKLGFSITIGAGGKAGIPFVAEGEVKVDVTASTDFTWGETHTTSRTWKSHFEVEAPPRKTTKAVASVTRSNIDIPVTIYSKSASTGHSVETKAIYHGVTTWDLRYTLTPI